MSVIIGFIADQPQVLTLREGKAHINDEPVPIKDVTQEDIDALIAELEGAPEGDPDGQEAYRHTRRILFLTTLLGRTFGEYSDVIEHMIGNLHYRVLDYLGEADAFEDNMERALTRRTSQPGGHGHEHEHGDGCCHQH